MALPLSLDIEKALIKAEKGMAVDDGKIVIDAKLNQNLLVDALKKLDIEDETILLEGHFCLLTNDEVFDVQLDTFVQLNLKAVFLLLEDVELICSRLKERDGKSSSLDIMQKFQDSEEKRARYVAETLNLPLFIGNGKEIELLINQFEKEKTE